MEKLKNGRVRVLLTAAGILLASGAVFIASIQIALGAEESRVVEQPAASIETALPAETQAVAEQAPLSPVASEAPVESALPPAANEIELPSSAGISALVTPAAEPKVTGEAVISDDPGPGYVTGGQAVDAYTKIATELFGLDVDKSGLAVAYSGKEEYNYNNNGVSETRTTHETWSVTSPDLNCTVDAVSGAVIFSERQSEAYPGVSITLGDFDNNTTGITPDGGSADMFNSPDDIYISAARRLVTDRLADGRVIENIMIDGVQFVWDNNGEGFDPNATGTVLVDCHVYMETGLSYTLSFLGTDQLVLHWFWSHPTHHACTWGYFYPEDGTGLPPESATGDWYTAPGVEGAYSDSPPPPMAAPGN